MPFCLSAEQETLDNVVKYITSQYTTQGNLGFEMEKKVDQRHKHEPCELFIINGDVNNVAIPSCPFSYTQSPYVLLRRSVIMEMITKIITILMLLLMVIYDL